MNCFIALGKGGGVLKNACWAAGAREVLLSETPLSLSDPAESWVKLTYLCTLLWEPGTGRLMKKCGVLSMGAKPERLLENQQALLIRECFKRSAIYLCHAVISSF